LPYSAKILDKDNVARLRAAREGELTTVAREVEPKDAVGFEVGQLLHCAAVERLSDDVRDSFLRVNVGEGATIGRPTERNAEGRREIKRLERPAAAFGVNWNMKSSGKRFALRLTA